jgi:hypothetical protein
LHDRLNIERKNVRKWNSASTAPIVVATILFIGCSASTGQGTTTEDTAHLTPIPKETLHAYQFGSPIDDRSEAVTVAWLSLDTTRLSYTETPKVLLAEEARFEDARRQVAQTPFFRMTSAEEIPGDTKVWLVLFEGDWQLTGPPPEDTVTLEPPSHACVYVIIVDPYDMSRTQIGSTKCSP